MIGKNLAFNSRNSLILEDRVSLERFIDGVMEVEDVVYVVMTGPEGKQLAAKSKGVLTGDRALTRRAENLLYPNPSVAKSILGTVDNKPVVTAFMAVADQVKEIRIHRGKGGTVIIPVRAAGGEMIYDFAVPVMRIAGHPFIQPFTFAML